MRKLFSIAVFLSLFASILAPAPSQAQDRPRAILVLDASGSMWGQIDGKAKIAIARDVIGGLLQTLPPDLELGLTLYGHRRKGDCNDIQTLIQPGTDRGAIADAVNAVKPKGKTPLSAAVIQAADALRYAEEPATVILISDGRETCHLDPCEVGRKLEETGVDFTAHVIGFDVADPAVRDQLACLAQATGGTYRSASDASELADALKVVAAPPPPPPAPTVSFVAVEGDGGPQISTGLSWRVSGGGASAGDGQSGGFSQTLPPGDYHVTVTRVADGASAETDITVEQNGQTVTLVLPPLQPAMTLDVPASAPAGSVISASWTGFAGESDLDQLVLTRKGDTQVIWSAGAGLGPNRTLPFQLPPQPGAYQLSYQREQGGAVVAIADIMVTDPTVVFSGPDAVAGGTLVRLAWTGQNYTAYYDTIAIVHAGDSAPVSGVANINTVDHTATLQAPAEAGDYELAYITELGGQVIARRPLHILAPTLSLSAPASAPAGSVIHIAWNDPAYEASYDRIAIVQRGGWDSIAEVRVINTNNQGFDIQVPAVPGSYDVIYAIELGDTVIDRRPLEILAPSLRMQAPETVAAGSDFTVSWSPPEYRNLDDRMVIVPSGGDQVLFERYVINSDGHSATLTAPDAPGSYDIVWITQIGQVRLATLPLAVTGN